MRSRWLHYHPPAHLAGSDDKSAVGALRNVDGTGQRQCNHRAPGKGEYRATVRAAERLFRGRGQGWGKGWGLVSSRVALHRSPSPKREGPRNTVTCMDKAGIAAPRQLAMHMHGYAHACLLGMGLVG